MIEKSIAAALEPVVDEIITLEKRINEIQLIPGPAGEAGAAGENGKDADVEEVAKYLVDNFGDKLKGADAEQVKAVDVAIALMEHHGKALIGPAGKDAEPIDVEALKADILGEIVIDDILKQMAEARDAQAIEEINKIFD